MKILELFCGTKSFSNVCKERGHQVMTMDINPQFDPTYCQDILNITTEEMQVLKSISFDIIWASPPCTTFSVASIGHHWTGGKKGYIPKTKEAEEGLKILNKTWAIIKELNPKYYIVENPRGMMRKFIPKPQTVTYCQYGDTRMKPTDIWTNLNWKGKRCKNGSPCHIAAPRGSRTGTQGLKDAKIRSIVPRDLCLDIIKTIEAQE